ncbi:hypothetical protein ACFH04_03640 [Streptomyces noboritoensis]|uniref:Resolvase/invertase-type recombinase catalytic domain-containing protein n=1 Tax=Streptomyces noboritoensis TaxID=67337 RepID=A0ABV6TAM4_9ACTN
MFAIPIGTGRGDRRVNVALYACVPDGTDPDATLDELRKYATARAWTVAAALYDVGPLDRAKEQRPGLLRVLRLIEDARIEGVVTPSPAHLAAALPLRSRAAAAFLCYTQHGEVITSRTAVPKAAALTPRKSP